MYQVIIFAKTNIQIDLYLESENLCTNESMLLFNTAQLQLFAEHRLSTHHYTKLSADVGLAQLEWNTPCTYVASFGSKRKKLKILFLSLSLSLSLSL